MVITGLTRNQLGSNPTRVRISPSPPEKKRQVWTCRFLMKKIPCGICEVRLQCVDLFHLRIQLLTDDCHLFFGRLPIKMDQNNIAFIE